MKNKNSNQFTAFYGGEGVKNGFLKHLEPVIILLNLKNECGHTIAPYVWVNLTKSFKELGLQLGDKVSFDATMEPFNETFGYYPHYIHLPHVFEVKLKRPINVEVVGGSLTGSASDVLQICGVEILKIEGRKDDK